MSLSGKYSVFNVKAL